MSGASAPSAISPDSCPPGLTGRAIFPTSPPYFISPRATCSSCGEANWQHLSDNRTFYIIFALLTLSAATLLNIVGLDVGKWLHNIGALAMWIPVGIVIIMGLDRLASLRLGDYISPCPRHDSQPHLNDIIFWSVLIFAFGGCETASFMGEEIKNARRTIPLALLSRRSDGDDLLHPGNGLRAAGVAGDVKSATCRD